MTNRDSVRKMDCLQIIKKERAVRRIIVAIICVTSLLFIVVFYSLKMNSRVVETIGTPPLSYESVRYTNNYTWPIIISSVIFAVAISFLIADLIFSRVYHVIIDNEDVVIYNNLLFYKLLVDGEEKDSTFGKSYLETVMKNGIRITASYQFFCSFHITFSDNRHAIDI